MYPELRLLVFMLMLPVFVPLVAEAQNKDNKESEAYHRIMPKEVRKWSAPDDKTLILEVRHDRKYKVTFRGRCIGLTFSPSINFVTHGITLDHFSSITLSDGTRCWFKSFQPYASPQDESAPPEGESTSQA